VETADKPCPRCQGTTFIDAQYAPLFEDYQADSDYQSNAAEVAAEPERGEGDGPV
jgi:hypothetical protein